MPRHHAEEWQRIQREVEKMLPDALKECGGKSGGHAHWVPNVDVYENADQLIVRMELAGVSKEDLEVTLHERVLLVRGNRPDPCRHTRCSFRQMEIDYGHFERRIMIPRWVDPQRVSACYRNGFLHIELPKSDQASHASVTIIIEQS